MPSPNTARAGLKLHGRCADPRTTQTVFGTNAIKLSLTSKVNITFGYILRREESLVMAQMQASSIL